MLNRILIDVRTSAEYRRGHLPGSINIPLSHIKDVQKYAPNKNTPIHLCCKSGSRSAQAKSILTSMGYMNITDMGGSAP